MFSLSEKKCYYLLLSRHERQINGTVIHHLSKWLDSWLRIKTTVVRAKKYSYIWLELSGSVRELDTNPKRFVRTSGDITLL